MTQSLLHGASVEAIVGQDTNSHLSMRQDAARTQSITCPPPKATTVFAARLSASVAILSASATVQLPPNSKFAKSNPLSDKLFVHFDSRHRRGHGEDTTNTGPFKSIFIICSPR
eukprot:533085_1